MPIRGHSGQIGSISWLDESVGESPGFGRSTALGYAVLAVLATGCGADDQASGIDAPDSG